MAAKTKKQPTNPNPGWTCEDINQNALVIFVLATFVVAIASGVLMAWFHGKYQAEEEVRAADVPAISKNVPSYNGADRLQPDPIAEMAEMKATQEELINSYGWVNTADNKVRVPIDVAIAAKLDGGFLKAADVVDPYEGKLVVRPIKFQMKFDQPVITVKAGEEIDMVFVNDDVQPHNLMICTPGSAEEVGTAGDKAMVSGAEAYVAAGYMPESDKILHKLGLVNPNETGELKFTAPAEPGEYVIICTFPGHWRTMNSILKVVK
jgi:azurin